MTCECNKNIELKIEKMYDDVILPKYQQLGDAGFDLHCYLYDEAEKEPVKSIMIYPGCSAKIHTGLKCEFPQGYYLAIYPRSSMGIKKSLALCNTVGIVDSEYDGEILIFVRNFGNEPVEILNGERIAQGILMQYPLVKIVEIDKRPETERGSGFGSSGRI